LFFSSALQSCTLYVLVSGVQHESHLPPRAHSDALASLLDFTPVVLRHRHDGWTPERQRLYVAALFETGHAGKAARAVGMTAQSAARLRRRPDAAGFHRACAAAYDTARRRWALARLASASPRLARRFDFLLPMGSRTFRTL
jgi:hypothetical protein